MSTPGNGAANPPNGKGGAAAAAGGLLLPLASLSLSLGASYPWLLWLGVSLSKGSWDRPILSLPAVIFLSFTGLFAHRFCQKRPWPPGLARAAVLALGAALITAVWIIESTATGGRPAVHAASLFALEQPCLLTFLAAALFWRQGLARGDAEIHYGTLYDSFWRGLAALVLLVLLVNWELSRLELPGLLSLQESAAAYLAAYFLFGLTGLALYTHRSFTEDRAAAQAPRRVFNHRLLVLLAASLAAILAVSVLLTGVVSTALREPLLNLLGGARALLGTVFYYAMVPFSYVVGWAFNLLKALMKAELEPLRPEIDLSSQAEIPWEVAPYSYPSEMLAVMHWVLLALLLGAVILILARATKIRSAAGGDITDHFHGSLSSVSYRLRPQFNARSRARAAMQRLLPRGGAFRSVRDIYRALLAEASRRGLERFAPETPYEYGARLCRKTPEVAAELREITERYVAERYGQRRHTPRELSETAAGWRKIKAALKQP